MQWAKAVSYFGLAYAVIGYYNETYFHWVQSVLLSGYSIAIAIVAFGLWRVTVEKLRYEKIRIAALTFFGATVWLLVPLLTHSSFLDNHVIGSVWFFSYLVLVFFFGRRADCGWNCTCAGVRDTVGDTFRRETPRGELLWKLRHVKWISLALILGYLFLGIFFSGMVYTSIYKSTFDLVVANIFYASLLVIPVTGNRNWCRFLCPWGALYGIVGKLGFFKIEAELEKCTDCGACDRICQMGIPVSSLIKSSGEVKVADCVGCGRCIYSCPTKALKFVDVRNYIKAFASSLAKVVLKPKDRLSLTVWK